MANLHRQIVIFLAAFLCGFSLAVSPLAASASAEEQPTNAPSPAGESCDVECLGRKLFSPPRHSENTLSLILGASFYAPDLAGHTMAPIGALYYRHRFDDLRVQGTFSIFVNDLSVSKTHDQFQLLGYLDNRTYPFTATEIVAGKEVPGTAIKWGTVNGRIGAGWRLPVSPFQMDNDMAVQLYYQLGYQYSKRVPETGPDVVLPPDTIVHGPLLRAKYDGMLRNRMELPHQGMAASMDVQYLVRSKWSQPNYGGSPFLESQTKQFLKMYGYVILATGIPYLSVKDRLLASVQLGYTPYGFLDRFSAFRVGGGPLPTGAEDLDRLVYPGAMFNQFPVNDYLIGSVQYRREIFPFLYWHLRGAYARDSRELFTVSGHGHFQTEGGPQVTTGFISGFFEKSELRIDYTYDSMLLRNGATGSNFVLLWSKPF